jgi:hypothetical protein
VDYSTGDAAATAGSDYTVTSGTLSWEDGDMGDKVITIPIIDDGVEEESEAFEVTLTSAGGGAGIDGSATLTVDIDDDDDNIIVPPPRPGGGGGGALVAALLGLLGLCLLSSSAQRKTRGRADDRADEVRLRDNRHA